MKKAKMTLMVYVSIGIFIAFLIISCIGLFIFRQIYSENTLIVYFSRVGNTAFNENVDAVTSASLRVNKNGELEGNSQVIAEDLQKLLGADIFRIEVEDLYPQEYDATVERASQELQNDVNLQLISKIENMEQYDKVVMVYPIWWGTIPVPVASFLEEYDFAGKTIFPIATHKGSFLGNSVSDIREILPNAKVKNGIAISGGSVDYLLEYWILLIFALSLFIVSLIFYRSGKLIKKQKILCNTILIIAVIIIAICLLRLLI